MRGFAMLGVLLFFSSLTKAQVVEEKIKWVSDIKAKPQIVSEKSDTLGEQKKFENLRKWSDCRQLAEKNIKSHSDLKFWILNSWFKCAQQEYSEKKKAELLLKPLQILETSSSALAVGVWRDDLFANMVKARLALAQGDLAAKPPMAEQAWKQVEILIDYKDRLEKTDRATLYAVAGDLAQQQTQLKAAQMYYEQSLNDFFTKSVKDKLNSLSFALNEKKEDTDSSVTEQKTVGGQIINGLSEEENAFEQRLHDSSVNNDLLQVIGDAMDYLQKFPGGRRAKWAHEKILSIYQTLADGVLQKPDDVKAQALQDKALSLMEKATPIRLLQWAQAMHRRSDYVGSLKMSDRALRSLSDSAESEILYYIAGRSAQFLGMYDQAAKYFSDYIRTQSGGENLTEVQFRLGLVYLRQKQYSSAVATFEKILNSKSKERYELSARYWMIRSLQMTTNSRADSEITTLIDKFPFSYYGLRLKSERSLVGANALAFDWPTSIALTHEISGSIYLLKSQKKIWQRVQMLAKQGWWKESLAELSQLPVPKSAESQALWARELVRIGLYPMAIRLFNQAGDQDVNLKSWEVVQWAFPSVYKKQIEEAARKQKLSPILVASLIRQESGFGLRAQSTSNAYGLMQLIGPTAQEVVTDLGLKDVNLPEDLFQPQINIQMGTFYLAKMIQIYKGHVPFGLAAYNAGAKRLQNFIYARAEVREQITNPSSEPWSELWMDEIPFFETSFYVKAILRNVILYSTVEEPNKKVQFPAVLWSELH